MPLLHSWGTVQQKGDYLIFSCSNQEKLYICTPAISIDAGLTQGTRLTTLSSTGRHYSSPWCWLGGLWSSRHTTLDHCMSFNKKLLAHFQKQLLPLPQSPLSTHKFKTVLPRTQLEAWIWENIKALLNTKKISL